MSFTLECTEKTAQELFDEARAAVRSLHAIHPSQKPLTYMTLIKDELETVIEATEMGSTLIAAILRRRSGGAK